MEIETPSQPEVQPIIFPQQPIINETPKPKFPIKWKTILFVLLFLVVTSSIAYAGFTIIDGKYLNKRPGSDQPVPNASQTESITPTTEVVPSLTVFPSTTTSTLPTTTKPTTKPTSIPKINPTLNPIPTSQPQNNSCSYAQGATGAINVNIKPSNGLVVGDQVVELLAKSGCKVLVNWSTDKDTRIARSTGNGYSSQNSVSFSTVPAGSYSVRIQYKGQWTGYSNVDAVSGQARTVEIFVQGETPTPIPTATPIPKPVCSVHVLPSSSGVAPYQASVCVEAINSQIQSDKQEYADFNGDGTWDYQGPWFGCHSYIFQTAGTYSPKGKMISSGGIESDICQTTVVVN